MNFKKALFFDLFHTLVDVASAPGGGGRYTADILGIERDAWNAACFSAIHDITHSTEHIDVIRTMARSIRADLPEALIIEATHERQLRFDHALENIEQETLDVLDVLQQAGYHLGLISNASSGEVAAWPGSPLAQRFDSVIFSCDCGYRKPQAAIYHAALDLAGVSSREALFIGDGGSDEHRGARDAGLDNVLITRYIGHYDAHRMQSRRAMVKWEISALQELLPLLGIVG